MNRREDREGGREGRTFVFLREKLAGPVEEVGDEGGGVEGGEDGEGPEEGGGLGREGGREDV